LSYHSIYWGEGVYDVGSINEIRFFKDFKFEGGTYKSGELFPTYFFISHYDKFESVKDFNDIF